MRNWRGLTYLPLLTIAAMLLTAGCATVPPGGPTGADGAGSITSVGGAVKERVVIPAADLGPETGQPIPSVVNAEDSRENVRAAAVAEDLFTTYRIGAGDMLGFRLFDDESLNTTVTVRHDGYISLPWVPDLLVAGLTREEATDLLTEAYNELYVDTEASLVILDSRSKFYTVMGEVSRPAEYPYERPLTLLDGINSAGGLRVNQRGGDTFMGAQGQLVKALVIRREGTERKVLEYDLRDFDQPGPHASETVILPGDIVYVPEGINLVYLLGEVGQSRVYALSEGMNLVQLLATAGGFSEQTGRMREVVVMREQDEGSMEVFHVNVRRMLQDGSLFIMQPGDIVYIPQKRLTSLSAFLSRLYSPATQTMGLANQVLGLYGSVWNAWYTDDRFESLYSNNNLQTVNTLELLRTLQDLDTLNNFTLNN